MIGLKITGNDEDFTLVAVIDPSRLSKKMNESLQGSNKELPAAVAFELRAAFIPVHRRLFQLKKLMSVVESSLTQIKKLHSCEDLIRLTITPTITRINVVCESLSKEGEVFAKVNFSRCLSLVDIEDDPLEQLHVYHRSRIGEPDVAVNQIEYRTMRNEIRIRMDSFNLSVVGLSKSLNVTQPMLFHALNKPFKDGRKPAPLLKKAFDYLVEKEKEYALA